MGTALAVSPFKHVVSFFGSKVPKVLFNMTNVFETSGYDFDKPSDNKILVKGKCDEAIIKLVKELGWEAEFKSLLPDCHKGKL